MTSKIENDIFSTRLKARQEDKRDIFEERVALREKEPSVAKDIAKQAAIGGAKGILGTYGDLLELLGIQPKEPPRGEQVRRDRQAEILEKMQQPGYRPSFTELYYLTEDAPGPPRIPSSEDVQEFVEALGISTEPQTPAGKYAGKTAEAIGGGVAFGGAPRALGSLGLGSLAGEAVEEITGSPIAGAITNAVISLSPAALKGKLAPVSKRAKEIVRAGRKAGLTEKELTPLIHGERKLAVLGKIARKGSKTQKVFSKIEEKLGDSYQTIKESASKLPALTESQNKKLLEGFGKINKDLRTTLKAAPDKESAIKFIEEAMKNVRNRGANPDELINFWQDVNRAVNWNAISGGKKSLAALKKPLAEVLKETSPKLYREFEQTNRLYSRFKKASKALTPNIVDQWINKGEMGLLAFGIATGNPWILKKVAGEAAIRIFSKELLTNPRLQNISNKMLNAVKNNKGAAASQLIRQSKKILEKKYPDEDWSFLEWEGTLD